MNANSNGVPSTKAMIGLAAGLLGVSAVLGTTAGSIAGFERSQEAITQAELRMDERIAGLRTEAAVRRGEIHAEEIAARQALETNLRRDIAELHEQINLLVNVLATKVSETTRAEMMARIAERIEDIDMRLERVETLVYGRGGGLR